jgi:hypothetical protein
MENVNEEKIVLLFCRENLTEINKTKLIGEIDINCFEGYLKPIKQAGVLIFVENDGSSKCFRNRYGSSFDFKFEDLTDDYRVVKYHEKLERLF